MDERTDFRGLGAGGWGWNPQLGDESPLSGWAGQVSNIRGWKNGIWWTDGRTDKMTDRRFNKVQTNFGLDKCQVGQMSRSDKRPGRTNVQVRQTSLFSIRSDKCRIFSLRSDKCRGRTNVGRTKVAASPRVAVVHRFDCIFMFLILLFFLLENTLKNVVNVTSCQLKPPQPSKCGTNCIFPFVYVGKIFSQEIGCLFSTDLGKTVSKCAREIDDQFKVLSWSDCNSNCPGNAGVFNRIFLANSCYNGSP